jgi:hypothetical protein
VRFSHHAKNHLRFTGAPVRKSKPLCEDGPKKASTVEATRCISGFVDGRLKNVVVAAADDPSYVITVFPKERG